MEKIQARKSASFKTDWSDEHFSRLEDSLNGSAGGAYHKFKQKAFDQFNSDGFPTTKNEAWKYTNLQPILKTNFRPAAANASVDEDRLASCLLGEKKLVRVFVNGFFSKELSEKFSNVELPKGVQIQPLAQAFSGEDADRLFELVKGSDERSEPLVNFNTALFRDGLHLNVEAGAEIEVPLQLIAVTTSGSDKTVSHPRFVVEAAEKSSIKIIEQHYGEEGSGEYLTSSVGHIFAEAGARVEHVKVQKDSEKACLLSTLKIVQKDKSHVETHLFSLGGRLARNEVYPVLDGEYCNTVVNGLTILSDEQHVDNYTLIDHALPNCESNELFKGIYADKSRGVFGGTIIVRPDAQKTNAIQSNKSILLSDDASVETRPQLKIWADDVKCTHGATVGQLDEEALFYLRSRGISKQDATGILVDAFATDVVEQLENEELVDFLAKEIRSKLARIIS